MLYCWRGPMYDRSFASRLDAAVGRCADHFFLFIGAGQPDEWSAVIATAMTKHVVGVVESSNGALSHDLTNLGLDWRLYGPTKYTVNWLVGYWDHAH